MSRAAVRYLKMSFMVNCDFEKGSQNTLVWREGVKKQSTLCRFLIMLTSMDDPLAPLAMVVNQKWPLVWLAELDTRCFVVG